MLIKKIKKTLNLILKISVGIPFGCCALFLLILGKCLGLKYKKISVYFNLYLQGTLLMISGAMPLIASVYNLYSNILRLNCLLIVLMFFYWSIYIVGLYWMIKHYKGDTEYAFNLCVADLKAVAKQWRLSYYAVNLIIFIGWWLTLLYINLFLAYQIIL